MNLDQLLIIHKKAKDGQKVIRHNKDHATKNLSCGDEVHIYLDIQDEIVKDASYEITGCSISTSFTYLLVEKIKGLRVEELKKINPDGFFDFLGVEPVSSGRIRCALISLVALKHALG